MCRSPYANRAGLENNRDKTEQAVTADRASAAEADRQLPVGGEIFLDHVGHFVRDPEAASRALARAGFAPTPVSVQANPDGTPTGTGNVTAMFSRGYIEVLFKTADTPLGPRVRGGACRPRRRASRGVLGRRRRRPRTGG